EDGRRHRVMLSARAPGEELGDTCCEVSGAWQIERFAREHYPGVCVMLNVAPGKGKLPLLGIDSGVKGEEKLLRALQDQERGKCACSVLLDRETARPAGLACRGDHEFALYALRVPPETQDQLRRHALARARTGEEAR
ncbi:MAG: hypothetical protein AMK73_08700, partial [Planctomycetes bacterium SM23_32]